MRGYPGVEIVLQGDLKPSLREIRNGAGIVIQ